MIRLPFLLLLLCSGLSLRSQNDIILGKTKTFHSSILNEERTLNIYLPPSYNGNDSSKYPVVYLLDGGLDEDFVHVCGIYQFNTFPWVNLVPESIVVGIVNVNRKRDFTFPANLPSYRRDFPEMGHSEKFISFLEKEVQPLINNTFRTNEDKTLIGQSLGGLLATEILLKKPEMFKRYIIISPSLWWDNASLLKTIDKMNDSSFRHPVEVSIEVGKEGQTPGEFPRIMEDDAKLLYEKLLGLKSKRLKIYFDFLPEENHATIGHHAIFNSLRLLYRKQD